MLQPENCIATYEPHAYCVVFSTTDRKSIQMAEEVLQTLWRSDHVSARAVILVGNKVDLVRCRLVSNEGTCNYCPLIKAHNPLQMHIAQKKIYPDQSTSLKSEKTLIHSFS